MTAFFSRFSWRIAAISSARMRHSKGGTWRSTRRYSSGNGSGGTGWGLVSVCSTGDSYTYALNEHLSRPEKPDGGNRPAANYARYENKGSMPSVKGPRSGKL